MTSCTPLDVDGAICIFVHFEIIPGHGSEFKQLADAHARTTMDKCGGCLRYDVVQRSADSFIFYEVYRTESDFAEHQLSGYLNDFRERRASIVAGHTAYRSRFSLLNGRIASHD